MKKSYLILFLGGALVAVGMILSYTGASMISNQVTFKETIVNGTIPSTVEKVLDPAINSKGVFVLRIENSDSANIVATIYDPSGEQVFSKKIDNIKMEEYFDINSKGRYTLEVRNGGEQVQVLFGLSQMPDRFVVLLNTLGQYMILSGFVGAAIAIIYAIKIRQKSS
ncbi:MAG TPA: hypothetical protein HA236_02060 [Candidatus Nitrosotenuis sp.]|mgnify:FL=1|jgi:flagellar hook assembly protein FlgD|nr:hypothetical protein [Candidatus Nitrosotenuis sp.]